MKTARTMTLSEAVGSYLAELGLIGRSPKTVELQTCLLMALCKSLGCRVSTDITRSDITQYLAGMTARGLAQSYIATTGKTIKRLFNWLVEQGELAHNPLQGMRLAMGPDKPIAPFTDNECRRLIMAANTPLKRVAILLLLDTGMRAGEIASLRLRDIDLDAGEITIMGKGGKTRRLALNERPRQALREYLANGTQQDGILWVAGWDRRKLGSLVDSVARRAHVPCCYPHRFRHNWAIRMRRAGVDAIDLQRLLGHASLKMTLRYISIVEDEVAVQVHKQHSVIPAA